ncbi:hypothetical protein GEMRC1_007460 [Eukaryota sp. GEM-RC1]
MSATYFDSTNYSLTVATPLTSSFEQIRWRDYQRRGSANPFPSLLPPPPLFEESVESTVIPQIKTFSFGSTSFCNKLHSLQKENLLVDTIIDYDDVSFHCHSFVVSCFSSYLKEKLLRSSSVEFESLPFLSDSDLFFLVLSTFYGQSLPITTKSLPPLSFIASLLQFEELSDFVNERMTKGLGNFEDNSFQLDLTSLVSKMITSCSRDVSVSYKNTALTMNSVLLALNSTFFYNSFTCGFADSNVRRFEYSEEFPGVTEEVFSMFLSCSIVNLSNLIFQISWIFSSYRFTSKLTSLNWLVQTNELILLLEISNERNQLIFIEENIQIFKILYTVFEDPIPLRVSFISILYNVIDFRWVTNCLMLLYETEGLPASELFVALNSLTTGEVQLFELFEILLPLFENLHFTSALLDWSVKIFKNVQDLHNIPHSWFLVTLREVDKTKCFSKHLNFLCQIFPSIITTESLSFLTDFCFSPACLELLCSKLPGEYCLWLARSLVNSWKNSEEFNLSWSVDSFVKCVEFITVLDGKQFEFLNIIVGLNDVSLEPFINSLISNGPSGLWPPLQSKVELIEPFSTGNEVQSNHGEAIDLLQSGTNLNHAESMFKLGSCYYLGSDGKQNFEKAAEYFKKSAVLGHVFGMVNIGYCYYIGKGVSVSSTDAFYWFKKAADLNNSEGCYRLSICYNRGKGVEQNLEESIRLLKIAVELGNAGAMTQLGCAYDIGQGVDKDIESATRFYQMAFEGGCSAGMRNLGI